MRLIEPNQITKMMSDLYISEDAINMTGERQGLWVRFRAIEKAVSEIPAIDAVEVVRCKECRHAYYADNRVPHEKTWVCERFMNEEITSNDFCSWGERKGGDKE